MTSVPKNMATANCEMLHKETQMTAALRSSDILNVDIADMKEW